MSKFNKHTTKLTHEQLTLSCKKALEKAEKEYSNFKKNMERFGLNWNPRNNRWDGNFSDEYNSQWVVLTKNLQNVKKAWDRVKPISIDEKRQRFKTSVREYHDQLNRQGYFCTLSQLEKDRETASASIKLNSICIIRKSSDNSCHHFNFGRTEPCDCTGQNGRKILDTNLMSDFFCFFLDDKLLLFDKHNSEQERRQEIKEFKSNKDIVRPRSYISCGSIESLNYNLFECFMDSVETSTVEELKVTFGATLLQSNEPFETFVDRNVNRYLSTKSRVDLSRSFLSFNIKFSLSLLLKNDTSDNKIGKDGLILNIQKIKDYNSSSQFENQQSTESPEKVQSESEESTDKFTSGFRSLYSKVKEDIKEEYGEEKADGFIPINIAFSLGMLSSKNDTIFRMARIGLSNNMSALNDRDHDHDHDQT